jgi:hypothetical protein
LRGHGEDLVYGLNLVVNSAGETPLFLKVFQQDNWGNRRISNKIEISRDISGPRGFFQTKRRRRRRRRGGDEVESE